MDERAVKQLAQSSSWDRILHTRGEDELRAAVDVISDGPTMRMDFVLPQCVLLSLDCAQWLGKRHWWPQAQGANRLLCEWDTRELLDLSSKTNNGSLWCWNGHSWDRRGSYFHVADLLVGNIGRKLRLGWCPWTSLGWDSDGGGEGQASGQGEDGELHDGGQREYSLQEQL